MKKTYYVYIVTNYSRSTFYVGFTDSLMRRTYEHQNEIIEGFSKKYHLTILVYYEEYYGVDQAISREKQLKNWHRDWKFNLIRTKNPELKDLSCTWKMPKQVRHDKK